MAKDMMQSGKDLDAMEHGADSKHSVQPSEASRGTGKHNELTVHVNIAALPSCT
jgi:hypothetical protein